MIYYFGGVNGVGKSTLLNEIAQHGDFEVVQLTDRLIEFMGVKDRVRTSCRHVSDASSNN